MYKTIVHGFILLVIFKASSTHILIPQNEWIPLSKEEVLRTLNRGDRRNTDFSDKQKPHLLSTPTLSTFITNNANAVKQVQPMKTLKLNEQNAYYHLAPDKITSVNDLQSNLPGNHEEALQENIIATTSKGNLELKSNKLEDKDTKDAIDTNFRRAKAISKIYYPNSVDINEERSENLRKHNYGLEQENNQPKLYEVTEDTREFEEEQSEAEQRPGYFYIPPNPSHSKANNLTNKFLDILSKYNIQPNENLSNYALSRRSKNHDRFNGYMFVPIPIRDFSQFSNLSLGSLAVLLSNYGFYLPGAYGIHGKYRNLYGYLASNNIHNNKPFGSYKIFSDTDSSN
ncbi:uncharacterized protein LOC114366280 [Ostrinia furnacalis]|uniref:uncharacterized protein LOC114366280 n=1 Tax=Ostrinia furnacalis TaxID=93504 RepID=UPI00103F7C45|nr:uncharacterized protein LOC114366280 [Ostrinia furnacalis]